MKTITRKAITAFQAGKKLTSGNTSVNPRIGGMELVLHGNIIARDIGEGLEINLCGWNTPTTRERLNGLPGVNVHTRKGQAFLNGEPIASNGWHKVAR